MFIIETTTLILLNHVRDSCKIQIMQIIELLILQTFAYHAVKTIGVLKANNIRDRETKKKFMIGVLS